jgi:beta-1,4-mannosyl-glycoprotein beta-1,4-N-acetylglucosaminyltransferase
MKVIDCFPFFNELDLLEIRLNELKDVVDVFVITESTMTFTGKPKPLYFDKERFKDFNIVYSIYEDNLDIHAMERERRQKQFNIDQGYKLFEPGDILMFSDVDEIPKTAVLRTVLQEDWQTIGLMTNLYYYYLNCRQTDGNSTWPSIVLTRKDRWVYDVTRRNVTDRNVPDAGYHFSFLGDIRYKLTSWGHADQFDKPPFNDPDHIRKCVEEGRDILMRKGKRRVTLEFVKDLSYLPKYVLDNLPLYERYIHTVL